MRHHEGSRAHLFKLYELVSPHDRQWEGTTLRGVGWSFHHCQ